MALALPLPVGDTPNWFDDETSLNSTPQSLVIHYSLRQSRNAWLTSVFPIFSSKSKNKVQLQQPPPPPHSLKFIAKCDVEIGPHVFHETSFYEAHYLSEPSQYAVGVSSNYPHPQTSYGKYSYYPSHPNAHGVTAASAPSSSSVASGPFLSSIESSVDVTPALIAQVNEAASSNPTLQNLLQAAAMGRASLDQLKTLGIFIQTLAAQHQLLTPAASIQGTQSSTPLTSPLLHVSQYSPLQTSSLQTIVKKPDLVLEFRENHNERFIIPREIVACEQKFAPGTLADQRDIVLFTFVPFANGRDVLEGDESSASRSATVIRMKRVTGALWETVWGWVNEDAKQPDARNIFHEKAQSCSQRVYLQYRLPESELLAQLRNACNNGYTMKSIKPPASIESTKPKRVRPRKPPAQTPRTPKATSNGTSAVSGADAQAVLAAAVGCASKPALKRRKSTPKRVPDPVGMGRGSIFINTMAPSPLPPTPTPAVPGPAFGVSVYPRFRQGSSTGSSGAIVHNGQSDSKF